jgi:sulfite reductase (NADPH) hemoprotein beta-component
LDLSVRATSSRAGFKFDEARQYKFEERSDYFGWHQGTNGLWYYTIFVENGRIIDDEKLSLKTALLEVALTDKSNFLFTANQNIIIGDVAGKDKEAIEAILQEFKITRHTEASSKIRKNSIACVALPTCPLALAEAQRYMPQLIDKIEPLLLAHGLEKENIIVRMTGCPNGCARPGAAEIAFVGTSAGHYNLQLGGDHQGERLNKIYKYGLNENEILAELDHLFASFKTDRLPQERLGDYVMRKEWV